MRGPIEAMPLRLASMKTDAFRAIKCAVPLKPSKNELIDLLGDDLPRYQMRGPIEAPLNLRMRL